MKLYSVTDGYIDYLKSEHVHVYSNKEISRHNTRKYLGVVVEIGTYKYYVPLSSPKDKDYFTENGVKHIKKDAFLIFRIISQKKGKKELRGTIRFANMIPVPDGELELYDANGETDVNYKNLVNEEIMYIRKHAEKIKKRAYTVYKKKTSGNDEAIMDYCLDYADLERMHDEWVRLVTNSGETIVD